MTKLSHSLNTIDTHYTCTGGEVVIVFDRGALLVSLGLPCEDRIHQVH